VREGREPGERRKEKRLDGKNDRVSRGNERREKRAEKVRGKQGGREKKSGK
jgi:hypothetical protein